MQELPVMVQYAVQVRPTKRLLVENREHLLTLSCAFITPESSSHKSD
jgi:hypothetical protein